MENILVPFQAISHFSCTQALVFAPHPDDEVFGCGGAIMRHVEHNASVRVIVLTDGAYGVSEEKTTEYISQRQQESIAAAQILGYGFPVFWQYRDRQIEYGEKLIEDILAAIREAGADLIYAPSIFEMHPDHRVTGMAVLEAVKRIGTNLRVALYEVGIPLHPNRLLDITPVLERKAQAMECFISQNVLQRYDQHIAALNRFRTYTLPANVTAAEAYLLVSAEELALDPLKLYQSEHARQAGLGLALDRHDIPLVSIIIRSMDRGTLSDALDSIALQTYPHIEAVVVNAKGDTHRDLGAWCGRFPLRMVGNQEHLGRSRAANIGLQEAQGDYLIFLDDDDWIEADHIDTLIQAIKKHPEVKVVYSGAKCVDENKNPLPTKFSSSFDRIQLIAGNYIVIHAALFARELLNLGCRVDETLDLYEDWDFWIQLSMHTDFLFVEKLSAVYRITQRSGFGVNADRRIVEQASLVLFKKWLPSLKEDELIKLMARIHLNLFKDEQIKEQRLRLNDQDQRLNTQEQQLKTFEQHIHDQEQHIKNQEHHIQHQQQHIKNQEQRIENQQQQITEQNNRIAGQLNAIEEIYSSNSWKITRPIRWLTVKIRSLLALKRRITGTLKYHGSFKGLAYRILQIAKQEGVDALLKKLWRYSKNNANTYSHHDSYQEWIRLYDTLTETSRINMRSRIAEFDHKPLISIIVTTYNSKTEWLTECIESVRKQIYPHWELCIADDASTDPTIPSLLKRYEHEDQRIRVIYRSENGHISAASNSALDIARGSWIALLDHDDLLSEHALFWVVDALQDKPDAALIYSDEDKIDSRGNRLIPYFKCDWNKELFYSQNLISHLGVYRTDVVKKIGGFRAGFEGSQDYDLALRCTEHISATQILHIPRILYHWRMHDASTALTSQNKPYAMQAGEKALNDHFKRQHINARAELINFGYRIHYAVPEPQPLVSLIIPTKNGLRLLRQCIDSILKKTTYHHYEILIIDNGSDDPATLEYLHALSSESKIRVITDNRPFNFSALNNNAVKSAHGEFIGLLNNDVEVISPDWLAEMISIASQPQVGAVGARLWYPNDTLQHGGVILGIGGVASHLHKDMPRGEYGYFSRANLAQALSAVTAACLIVRKSIYEEVNGMNESDLQVAFNDVDFCLRIRETGYHNVWTPYAELYHHESATRGYENTPEKQSRLAKEAHYMKQRWGDQLSTDPAYNPNLTLEREDFSLAHPPRMELLID